MLALAVVQAPPVAAVPPLAQLHVLSVRLGAIRHAGGHENVYASTIKRVRRKRRFRILDMEWQSTDRDFKTSGQATRASQDEV